MNYTIYLLLAKFGIRPAKMRQKLLSGFGIEMEVAKSRIKTFKKSKDRAAVERYRKQLAELITKFNKVNCS